MQLSKHIGTAAWSAADKSLYVLIGLAFILPQKVIGEHNWGVATLAQAGLTIIYMLSDGFALQALVNFGMTESRRRQALTVSAILHVVFITICTAIIYFGRGWWAEILNEPDLVPTLALFPLVALGFLLRNYFLKISQLHIDTRATFLIDAAWIGTTVLLVLHGWMNAWMTTAEDMMLISAASAGASSLVGLMLYARRIRFTRTIDREVFREMMRFGRTQMLSAGTLALQTQGDYLLLKLFVSSSVVGNYDAAKKLFRGFEALRDAGSLFVYPAVARLKSQGREGEMVLLVEKMIGFMTLLAVPVVIVVWIGPTAQLFELIYRGKYQQAAFIFQLMCLAGLAIPFSMNINVLNGLSQARALLRVILMSAGMFFLSGLIFVPMIGVHGMAITIAISYVALGFFSTRAVKKHISFSIRGAFGRWRDAVEFIKRQWKKKGGGAKK